MKKYTLIALGLVLIGILVSSAFLWLFLGKEDAKNNIIIKEAKIKKEMAENIPENAQNESLSDVLSQNESTVKSQEKNPGDEITKVKIPDFIENKTPFISQAPFGVWDELHDEACEEAVIIIANGFLNDVEEISKEKADKEINALVAWQLKKYGKHKDLTLKEIRNIAFDFYGDKLEISDEISEQSFKKILIDGNIIIIPIAGREIGNPFFTPPGPLYHALVVIGYDESTKDFITNDPGTKRGEGFRYSYESLLKSVHDFPGEKEKILEGIPRVLIVKKV